MDILDEVLYFLYMTAFEFFSALNADVNNRSMAMISGAIHEFHNKTLYSSL